MNRGLPGKADPCIVSALFNYRQIEMRDADRQSGPFQHHRHALTAADTQGRKAQAMVAGDHLTDR